MQLGSRPDTTATCSASIELVRDPVVIVGGGIGGLTAALALQRRDVPCVVYERAPELQEIGAGVALWPSTLRALDELGVGDDVRALRGPWKVGGVLRSDGRPIITYTVEEFAQVMGEPTAGVHRGELQQLLLHALAPGTVRTGRECATVTSHPDRASVTFTDGTTTEAPVVIGADGRRSKVRSSVFGARSLHDLRSVGWRGTAPRGGAEGWGDFAGEMWGPTGRFGILPISNDRVTWFCAVGPTSGSNDREEILERFGSWPAPVRDLIDATDDAHLWTDRLDDRLPSRRWTSGRVALLGDAAHPMSPDLGQGACQAIFDAVVLADELDRLNGGGADRAGGVEDALRRYERRRRWKAAAVTMVARASTAGARTERPALVDLRCRVAGLAPRRSMLKQLRWISSGP